MGKWSTPIQRVHTCPFCRDYKGDPKPIPPERQHLAKKMPDGSYMCYQCQTESALKLMRSKS